MLGNAPTKETASDKSWLSNRKFIYKSGSSCASGENGPECSAKHRNAKDPAVPRRFATTTSAVRPAVGRDAPFVVGGEPDVLHPDRAPPALRLRSR